MADEKVSKGLVDAAFKKKKEEEGEKVKEEDKATEGDIITFELDGQPMEAIVTSSRLQNSVVCDMTIMENFDELNFEHEKTVVAHKNYTIKERRRDS